MPLAKEACYAPISFPSPYLDSCFHHYCVGCYRGLGGEGNKPSLAAVSLLISKGKRRLANDHGIAIGPILFIVAVLGILAAAITAGSGAFNTNTKKENAGAMAAAIIDYVQGVDVGVEIVAAKGYPDTEISFQLPSGPLTIWGGGNWTSDTANANCTTTDCKVYYTGGGGAFPNAMPPSAFDTTILSTAGWGCAPGTAYYRSCVVPWTYQVGIRDVGGDTTPDLALLFMALNKNVCIKLNEHVGVANPGGDPPTITNGMQSWKKTPFIGTYDFVPVAGNLIGDNNPDLVGKKDFCYLDAAYPTYGYLYAHVVLVR
jgi:hypothetical protein